MAVSKMTCVCILVNMFLLIHISVGQLPLSERLWQENEAIANSVYATTFLQGIEKMNLDEAIFRKFNMPDIWYVNAALGYVKKASARCTTSEDKCKTLRDYVTKYEASRTAMLDATMLENTDAIKSTPAFNAYAAHYNKVATTLDPAYMLVAIYPCSRLWNWFAKKIKTNTNMETNPYRTWISDNAAGSGGSSLKKFIDAYQGFDETTVKQVFKTSMQKELGIFQEASPTARGFRQSKNLKDLFEIYN